MLAGELGYLPLALAQAGSYIAAAAGAGEWFEVFAAQAGLFGEFPGGGGRGSFSGLGRAGGQVPAPAVGDEAVPVQ